MSRALTRDGAATKKKKRKKEPWILSLTGSPIRSGTSVGDDRRRKSGGEVEERHEMAPLQIQKTKTLDPRSESGMTDKDKSKTLEP